MRGANSSRSIMAAKKFDLHVPEVDLTGTAAIVTGGTDGLGRSTVVQLALRGAMVIVAGRNPVKGQRVVDEVRSATSRGESDIVFEKCSLDDLRSVKSFAERMTTRFSDAAHPPLKILYLNAGIAMPPFSLTGDNIESQFQVNYLSHFYLVLRLYSFLAHNPASPGSIPSTFLSRIISTSSAGHKVFQYESKIGGPILFDKLNDETVYSINKAYGQSKGAQIVMTSELARRIPLEFVEGNQGEGANASEGKKQQWRRPQVKLLATAMIKLATLLGRTPDEAVGTQLYVGVAKDIEDAVLDIEEVEPATLNEAKDANGDDKSKKWWGSLFFMECAPTAPQIHQASYFVPETKVEEPAPWTQDAGIGQRLWDFSLALLREKLGEDAVVVPEELSKRRYSENGL
ncbi:Retinol dehydrogenase 12 [Quaeritorhiza haematococci]|nr:Retinol dehydrogenase 12 [Quaeritorhiza haematococci]